MKPQEEKEKEKIRVPLKPYNTRQLAKLYDVSAETFRKWIKPFAAEIGKRNGYYFSIGQVKIIFQKLHLPSFLEIE